MRLSRSLFVTLRDVPSDAEVPSHALLARGGYIQKLAAGIYVYGPWMWRTIRKVSEIVREEMARAGAEELAMPVLQPREIWEESGRWDGYLLARILFHLKDRKDADLCLGPTHEEVITTFVKRFVTSYKQLPLTLYQIQTKFRDEIRPRFGLMRGREFLMKDAYSFDADEEGLERSYRAMHEAYHRAFSRCGLDFTVVEADPGAIGGSGSQEFMVNAATGEDAILRCPACKYAANVEKADSRIEAAPSNGSPRPLKRLRTPGMTSVEQLAAFTGLHPAQMTKTVLYRAAFKDREEVVAVLVRGDQEVNEVKLGNVLGALAVEMADEATIRRVSGAAPGFAGPIGLKARILADPSARGLGNTLCGANETDAHCIDVNLGRDFPEPEFRDLRKARATEGCPRCAEGRLEETRGIEVGHIFKLGTKYSKAMGASFAAADGELKPFVMGCYGIGVSRVAAAAVEQNHDAAGIRWPAAIAPYHAMLVCVNVQDETQRALAEDLYGRLAEAGVETAYDDRPLSPGIKFKDADLVGLPIRLVVGRDAKEGKVEIKERRAEGIEKVAAAGAVAAVRARLDAALAPR
ncbi:MAG TPA: proline--tRNA ligase [Planctomycetota bacterium]|nr:proline--tRNA ligase [Planctomycetota bacterium]